jgi:hypothetical protein
LLKVKLIVDEMLPRFVNPETLIISSVESPVIPVILMVSIFFDVNPILAVARVAVKLSDPSPPSSESPLDN